MSRHSLKAAAAKAAKADAQQRKQFTGDSFANFAANLGLQTNNLSAGATYGFNPISRIRQLLEWIYRGSWLAGVAVDCVSDDMTREGIRHHADELPPEDSDALDEELLENGTWTGLAEAHKWGRLYGGGLGIILIDGQDDKTPLRVESVGKDQYKGILALDRWQVEPSLNDVVTAKGPDMGLPKFYRVMQSAPGLQGQLIHYSRVVRFEGVRQPYQQRLAENLWGISVFERLYDRMVAFDSATTGAAQLVYKAYLRTLKVEGLRDIAAEGGEAQAGLVKYMHLVRLFQGIEGITLVDGKDEFGEGGAHQSLASMPELITQFAQQLAGALQIPLTRLMGTSAKGLNATGEGDERNYESGIKQSQTRELKRPVTMICRLQAQSLGIKLPEGYRISFRPLRQLTDGERATVAKTTTEAVGAAKDDGLLSQAAAMKELRASSHVTGIFSSITDDDIAAAEEEPRMPPLPGEPGFDDGSGDSGGGQFGDRALASMQAMKKLHDLDVAIENEKGTERHGLDAHGKPWTATLPADYGYIRRTTGADADQVDCFIGPHPESAAVLIVNQRDLLSGSFDEHKVLLGFKTPAMALAAYQAAYHDGRGGDRVMSFVPTDVAGLKTWLATADLNRECLSVTKPLLRAVS